MRRVAVLRLPAPADLPIKVARIFNTYGPGMDAEDGRVVSNFIVQALRGDRWRSSATDRSPGRSAMSMIWSTVSLGLMDTGHEVTGR